MDRDRHIELQRLEALSRYDADDVPPEAELAGLVRVAAVVAGVPTATLNLLEATVQRNYATEGFEGGTCRREDALCAVALRERGALHVEDASRDPRLSGSPWVDGRLDTIRLYASSPLTTPDGWMIGTLCVFDSRPGRLDPAVLRALDDLAAQAMALLERRRLARLAQEAARARAAEVAAVSHDLRTPMNGVLGMLDLALSGSLPAAAREQVGLARRSAAALLGVVDDVLAAADGQRGLSVVPRPFDPAALVHEVGSALRVLAARKGLTLLTRVDPGVPTCLSGDPDRLRQVLVNLVGNALKFTPAGSVELSLTVEGAAGDGVDLVLAVADTGEGIAPEELPTLFERFTQGRSGRRHGGTGLGLANCAHIAAGMGGRLDVDSALGEGSTFTLRLRLPTAAAEGPAAQDEPQGGALEGLRVLVADDSDVNRTVALGLLRALGADGDAVADGAYAVAQVQTGAYDVVLLDHEMPGLDGLAAARLIRGLGGETGRLPIWALTGRVGGEDVLRCTEAGMDGVLSKPIDVAELERVLAGVRVPAAGG